MSRRRPGSRAARPWPPWARLLRAALALGLGLVLGVAAASGQNAAPSATTGPGPSSALAGPEAGPGDALPSPEALEILLARTRPDPRSLRATAEGLVRAGRIQEAMRLVERAVELEQDAARGEPTPGTSRANSEAGSSELRVVTFAVAGGLLLALLVGIALVARSLRQRGDLGIVIDYPMDRRGNFSIRLAREPGSQAPTPADAAASTRASTRFEHTRVTRETRFQGIPAREWYVRLVGTIEEREGMLTEVDRELEVHLASGQSEQVTFDLKPRECPLEVHALRRGVPAEKSHVVLAGDPDSLVLAREGVARFDLPLGRYRVIVGHEDRIAEAELELDSLDARTLSFDLDEPAGLVFRSCEAAVLPYLEGEQLLASNALERAGQRNVAHLVRASAHRARGEFDSAAIHYEAAGQLLDAAEVQVEAGACERAAMLFERAGDAVRAAEMHQAAGDPVRAGRCFEEAGDLEQAVECYREADAIPKLMDVLEKSGNHFEAGRLAQERGESPRAVRNLQQVDPRHPEYSQACRILAETFVRDDKIELAVQKADEAITFAGDEIELADYVWYADVLEKAGRTERALRVFRDLAKRNTENEDLKAAIARLEARFSKEQIQAAGGGGGVDPAPGVREIKRYELVQEIGRGGMGIVYKARDRRLGRIVALKRMPDTLRHHPRAVDLFVREARSAAALNHVNIVTVYDVDQEDGVYILTMELLRGAPLHRILRKRGRLSSADAARLGIQIAHGLEYAHQRGIVHRDIKTANLFFTNDKVVKIMDFGLAKALDELRRSATQVTGTPYYMAPEQVSGVGVDHRVDLYGLGVTLFELLTGELPFMDGDILFQHKEAPPPDPREIVASVAEPMAKLVLKLMSKAPADRAESAAEVSTALQQIAESLATKRS